MTERISGRMKRLNRDPERWVDSDMVRDEWLLVAKHYALLFLACLAFTILVIGLFS